MENFPSVYCKELGIEGFLRVKKILQSFSELVMMAMLGSIVNKVGKEFIDSTKL